MRIINLIPVIGILVAANISVPLNAQSLDVVSHSVAYADLNLGRAEGREALDRRIAMAVRQVCEDLSAKDLASNRAVRNCRSDALAAAAKQRDAVVANYDDRRASDAGLAMRNR